MTHRPVVVHLTTTDMSLDWLLGPQLQAFADAGYRVIGMSAPGPHVDHLREQGVEHVALSGFTRSRRALDDVRAFWQLVAALRRVRPDIVHTHNPKPGVLGRIAGRLCRVPLVVNTQHGLYAQPTDRRRRRWPVYAAERIAAAFSHVELVQSPEDVDTLIHRLHVPVGKVVWLGNGIDLDRFSPATIPPAERTALRHEWQATDDDLVVGVVGRLVAEKGIAEICAAAARLTHHRPRLRMVVIGPADDDKEDAVADDLVEAAGRDGVVFTGRRDDMPRCYAAMDLFVTASWREGFPRAAMEAAAMGLPIVATDVRGNRQVVDDGVTGVLVPVRDPDALAAAIVSLADRPDTRRSMSAAAVALAAREFGQQRVIDRTLDTYRRLNDARGVHSS